MPKAPSEIPSALDNNSTKKQKLHGFLLYACHAGCRAERSRCRRWLRCSPSGKLSKTQTRAATHRTTAKKKEGFHFGGPRRLLGFSWQRLPDLFLLGIAEAFQGPEMMDPGTFCPPRFQCRQEARGWKKVQRGGPGAPASLSFLLLLLLKLPLLSVIAAAVVLLVVACFSQRANAKKSQGSRLRSVTSSMHLPRWVLQQKLRFLLFGTKNKYLILGSLIIRILLFRVL